MGLGNRDTGVAGRLGSFGNVPQITFTHVYVDHHHMKVFAFPSEACLVVATQDCVCKVY